MLRTEVKSEKLKTKDGKQMLGCTIIRLSLSGFQFLSMFCLIAAFRSYAQTSSGEAFRIGLIGDYSRTMYVADFMNLPGCPDCRHPNFTEGNSDNFVAGIFGRMPISRVFSLDIALMYADLSGKLSSNQQTVINALDGGSVQVIPALLRQTVDATIHTINVEPQLNCLFSNSFRLSLGVSAGFVIKNSATQSETLVSPEGNYVFIDSKSRTRIIYSGDISDMKKILLSFTAGLGYDIAFRVFRPVIITPQVSYSLGLMNIVDGYDWKINGLRAGLRVSYPFGGD